MAAARLSLARCLIELVHGCGVSPERQKEFNGQRHRCLGLAKATRRRIASGNLIASGNGAMNAVEHGVVVAFDRLSLVKGGTIRVVAQLPRQEEPVPIQFEIGKVGVLNPHWVLTQSGTLPPEHEGSFAMELDTSNLGPGFYELGRVQVGPNTPDPTAASMIYLGARDFPRCIVRIREADEPALDEKDILTSLVATESAIEEAYLSPSDARASAQEEARQYTVAWFVKDLLVKTPMRFDRFQLVPTGRGLNAHDSIDLVKRFFQDAYQYPVAI
ncbi:hypothetical protein ACTMU2_29185 [Cupriavidus basilensis]